MTTLEGVFRREVGPCTATLIRLLGDIDLAEEAVAEAFAIAAELWPVRGIPVNPGGWITTTARNRAIDRIRRESMRTERHVAAHQLQVDPMEPGPDGDRAGLEAFIDVVADDQLRLMFLCCHPALGVDAQVALTLRLLGGLETAEIAHAFLVPEATMAQRLVRSKRKLRDNRAPYRIPRAAELPDRLQAVLAAIYLIYTEGHTATSGASLTRLDLSAEAIRLARVLVSLLPHEPEVVGLLALLLLTEARRPARMDAQGSVVRLADQDRSLWDQDLIEEGHSLVRACLNRNQPGAFQIQAAIAAVHADAPTSDETDWPQIVALYDQLFAIRPDSVECGHLIWLHRGNQIWPHPEVIGHGGVHLHAAGGGDPWVHGETVEGGALRADQEGPRSRRAVDPGIGVALRGAPTNGARGTGLSRSTAA